jgi:hypothetical protein
MEAVSGFEPGATVIVLGQSGLKDGSLVRAVKKPTISMPPTAPDATAVPAATPAPAAAPATSTPPAPAAPVPPAAPGKS